MAPDPHHMQQLTEGLKTKSDKIRTLDAAGYARADIARFLDIRYQHVRNVLVQQPSGQSPQPTSEKAQAAAPSPAVERLQLGPGGRIVIPAAMREAMGLEEGATLLATLQDGELRLITPKMALERAQAIVRKCGTGAADLLDGLIEERRDEARRESAESDNG